MALRPTRETAQTTPVPVAVPSSTRLDCSLHLGAAPEGAYLFGRPGGHPVFLMSEPVGGLRLRAGTDGAWHGRPDRQHSTPTRPEPCAALAEQVSAGAHVLATARRMKGSSPTRSHGQ